MKLSELIAEYPHLDMDVETHEGDVIADAILLLRTASMGDMTDALGLWSTDGLGGVTQYGIVCAAKFQLEQWMWNGKDA